MEIVVCDGTKYMRCSYLQTTAAHLELTSIPVNKSEREQDKKEIFDNTLENIVFRYERLFRKTLSRDWLAPTRSTLPQFSLISGGNNMVLSQMTSQNNIVNIDGFVNLDFVTVCNSHKNQIPNSNGNRSPVKMHAPDDLRQILINYSHARTEQSITSHLRQI